MIKRILLLLLLFSLLLPFSIRAQNQPARIKAVASKAVYSSTESPQIKLDRLAAPARKFLFFTRPPLAEKNLADSLKVVVTNPQGQIIPASAVNLKSKSATSVDFSLDPSVLTPGKYLVKITDSVTGETTTQDFTWGVLALNPNQSTYLPGQTATLAMAVLDSDGNMVCDAQLNLTITSPDGKTTQLSTTDKSITISPQCQLKTVGLNPDYETNYITSTIGTYSLNLSAQTKSGSYSITDSFEVAASPPYLIERLTATRIYPLNLYPVTINFTPKSDFSGTITDSVPLDFKISSSPASLPYKIEIKNQRQYITWSLTARKNQTLSLSYLYDAPDISPELFSLGPLQVQSSPGSVYLENRSWQIASDAVVFSDGYESGSASAWSATYTTGTGTTNHVIAGAAYSGNYGLHLNVKSNSGGYALTSQNITFGSGDEMYAVYRFRRNSTSGTGVMQQGTFGIAAPLYVPLIVHNYSNGTDYISIRRRDGTTQNVNFASNLSTNQWYQITMVVDYSGTYPYYQLIVDGVSSASYTDTTSGTLYYPSSFNTALREITAAVTTDVYYDDVALHDTPPNPPSTPTNTTPGVGATGISLTPTLVGSTFADPNPGDTLQASQFQVATDTAFSSLVFDTGTTGAASNSASVTTTLSVGTTYYWRFRYQDNNDIWSSYSAYTAFSTNRPPSTPTNSTPANLATGVTTVPTLVASAFSDPDGDTHASSQWQLSLVSNFASTIWDSGTDATHLTSAPVGIGLSYSTTYYYHVRYRDNLNNWSTYSTTTSFTTQAPPNLAPTAPTDLQTQGLTNPESLITTTPYFSAIYNDPDSSDIANRYQIRLDNNSDFSSVFWDSGASGTSMSDCSQGARCGNITYSGSALTRGTTYYWQIRYWDQIGSTSPYSAGTNSFKINQLPATPTNTTPANGAASQTFTPTLTASAFSDPDAGNTQSASQFQVATDTAFSAIVFDTGATGAASNSVALTTTLSVGTTYYWRVRYQDSLTEWSSYSSYTSFSTNQKPSTPTNSTPANLATGVTTVPTLTASSFSDPDASDTHASSQWQLSLVSNFASTIWDSGTDSTHLTSAAVGIGLSYSTTYYYHVRYRDDKNNWSDYSTATSFTTQAAPNVAPNTPTNTTPANGAASQTFTPTLTASAFSDSNPGDTQSASQWQLATDTTFSSIVFDTGTTGAASNSVSVTTTLSVGTTYYWHVRYQDNNNTWSSYSSYTSFSTNQKPSTPTNSTPANLATGVTTVPTLTASAYSDPDTNAQANSQWQLATDSGFSSIIFDTGTTGAASNSVALTTTLNYSTLYYWHVRYKDNQNNWSDYSTATSFTTQAAPNVAPNTPTNTTPANGAASQTFTPTLTASTFSDPNGGDTQNSSQWQVSTNTAFSSIVFDTGTTGAASNSVSVTTTLSVGTTYYWHVRYQDNNGAWSSYSSYTAFSTNQKPSTPTNSTPANLATDITTVPTLTASAFSDPDASDTQASSQWQLATDSGFSSIIFDTGTTGAASNSVALTTTLNYSTLYYYRVRYRDNLTNWSDYSTATSFTTQAEPPSPTPTSTINRPDFYWKFDEGAGTSTSAQNRALANFVGTPVWTQNGKSNRAIAFNGSTSRLALSSSSGLDFPATAFSISAWIYPTNVTGIHSIFSTSNYIFYIEDGQLKFQKSSASWDTVTAGTISVNQWVHVAFSRAGTGTNQSVLYINGRTINIGTISNLGTNTTAPIIGGELANGRYFSGTIDELRIYPRPLTEAEVKIDYNSGSSMSIASLPASSRYCLPGDTSTCSPPVSEYKFDEGIGTSAYDTSGQANHALITQATWVPAKIGRGLRFNGSSAYASAPNSTSSVNTISFWAKPSTTSQYFLDFDGGTHYIYSSSGQLFAAGFTSPTIYVNGLGTTSLTANVWQHITVTTASDFDATSLTIGKSGANYYNGLIDQIQIYDYARTASQIAYDYNRGDPVAWYKFDECTGTQINDWSGNGLHATLSVGASGAQSAAGSCTTPGTAWGVGATGRHNSSLSFDGTDDSASATDSHLPVGANPHSFSFWIKPSALQNKVALGYGTVANLQLYSVILDTSGHIGLWWNNNSPSTDFSKTVYTANRWNHITFTYNGSNIISYVNGIKKDTVAVSLNLVKTGVLKIGDADVPAWASAYHYFSGQLDDVRIFNYPLTADQIKLIYNAGSLNFR